MKRLFLSLACLIAAIPAAAEPEKLTPDAQARLDAKGLVIVDQPLRQGFSAYLGGTHPLFITSDSLLMAYHRIFEEMVGEIEAGQLAGFRDFSRELWKNLPVDAGKDADADDKEGLLRARLLVATASRLLTGTLPEGLSEAELSAVTSETTRVEKGEGQFPPAWILPDPKQEDHVSYAAFQPGGLFEGRETMERYYRFRKWLQEMQVDIYDKVTLSMLSCLRTSVTQIDEEFRRPLREFFAPGDFEKGVLNCLGEISDSASWSSTREAIQQIHGGHLPAHRVRLLGVLLPGGSKITSKLVETSPLPVYYGSRTPEAVGSALGNPFASSLLAPPLQEAVKKCGDFSINEESSFNGIRHYYEALRALNAPPDARAPALFRSEPWQRKQLNASLGSWTEYRNALLLGSREQATFFGLTIQEPGFVEPVPAFYRWLGESAEALEINRSYYSTGRLLERAWIVRLEDLARQMKSMPEMAADDENQAFDLEHTLRPYHKLLGRLFPALDPFGGWFPHFTEDCHRLGERLELFTKSWWAGDPEARHLVQTALAEEKELVGPRLSRLAGLCFRLEAMAERQLAGQPWTAPDLELFDAYGRTLGWLMFYEGNSYESPRDDAPRIVRYASVSDGATTRVFHAATSQPRLLLIRYPDRDGKDVLCQGAVYAYRDVASDQTPTKQQWQAEAKASAWPEWMKPVVGSYEPPVEKKKEE